MDDTWIYTSAIVPLVRSENLLLQLVFASSIKSVFSLLSTISCLPRAQAVAGDVITRNAL